MTALVIALMLLTMVSLGADGADATAPHATDPATTRPDMLFFDDFETGDTSKWDPRSKEYEHGSISITHDPKHVRFGKYALEVTGQPGLETGGSLITWFMPGYDQVYARWYCQFAEDFDQGNMMHFNRLFGGPPNDPFAAFGHAGTRPTGTDRFTTGIEPWRDWGKNPAPGALGFYSYFPDMKQSSDGHYWGNMYFADPKLLIVPGRWYCMEMMLKANTPGKHDGEQAAWVDGKEVIHVTGLRWRDIPELKIHAFRLSLYLHDSPKVNRVWFDNIAVSTKYIGPAE